MSAEPSTPKSLRLAATFVGLEGAAAVIAGSGFAVAALAGHPTDKPTALTLSGLLVLLGLGLLAVARGLLRANPAAAAPAYVAQFVTLVVAYYQRQTLIAVTVVLAVVAVAAVAALSAPASREMLRRS